MFKDDKKNTSENAILGSNRIVSQSKIKGEIDSQSDFRIDGEVEGTITTTGKVVVGKTGLVKGKIICVNADVEGHIQGSLEVKNTLNLKSTANIQGEVKVTKLMIEPGAIFNVTCVMGDTEKKEAKISEKK